jgi:hypothetical protein
MSMLFKSSRSALDRVVADDADHAGAMEGPIWADLASRIGSPGSPSSAAEGQSVDGPRPMVCHWIADPMGRGLESVWSPDTGS